MAHLRPSRSISRNCLLFINENTFAQNDRHDLHVIINLPNHVLTSKCIRLQLFFDLTP